MAERIHTVDYASVKVGDLVWNKLGFSRPLGHWTRVLATEREGDSVVLTVADGYQQWGHAREGIAVMQSL